MLTRERLHFLVGAISEDDLEVVQHLLEQHATDPVLLALAGAPEDDESLTPEDEVATRKGEQEGLDALARGDVISDEQLRRELGL